MRILAMIFEGLDWYSAAEIGLAVVIVGTIALIAWLQGPPRG